MTNPGSPKESIVEKNVIQAIQDRAASKASVLQLIKDIPAGEHFVMKNVWVQLSLDDTLENWRRLEAYKMLIHRCLTYPIDMDSYIKEAIAALNINRDQIVDMTMAQMLPIGRENAEAILMANLPIVTSLGPAAVYFAIRRSTNTVEEAVVYPNSDGEGSS